MYNMAFDISSGLSIGICSSIIFRKSGPTKSVATGPGLRLCEPENIVPKYLRM